MKNLRGRKIKVNGKFNKPGYTLGNKILLWGIIVGLFICTLITTRSSYAEFIYAFQPTATAAEMAQICDLKDVVCENEAGVLPKANEVKIAPQANNSKSTIREVTAYNAGDPAQTDSSPCISANGENVCEALAKGYKRCAANFVPFGTILRIAHYGDCMVTDRMNSRFANRVDIAMQLHEKQRAVSFGLQRLNIEILSK